MDLLAKTIKFSFQERVTLEEALKHPFFDKVRSLPDVQEANSLTSPTMLKKAAGQLLHKPDLLEFDSVPSKELTKSRLRELILQEIAFYRNVKKRRIILPAFKSRVDGSSALATSPHNSAGGSGLQSP